MEFARRGKSVIRKKTNANNLIRQPVTLKIKPHSSYLVGDETKKFDK